MYLISEVCLLYVLSSFFLEFFNSVNLAVPGNERPRNACYVVPLDRRSSLPGLKGSNYASMKFAGLLHIGSISFIERVEEFKYLGTTLTNKNSIQEEIKSRLKVGNACYYWVQNLLSSSLLSKNLKIKIRNIER